MRFWLKVLEKIAKKFQEIGRWKISSMVNSFGLFPSRQKWRVGDF